MNIVASCSQARVTRFNNLSIAGGGSGSGGAKADQTQRRCLDAALGAIGRVDCIMGVFRWEWFPGRARYENFLMSTPAMFQVITDQRERD